MSEKNPVSFTRDRKVLVNGVWVGRIEDRGTSGAGRWRLRWNRKAGRAIPTTTYSHFYLAKRAAVFEWAPLPTPPEAVQDASEGDGA